MTQHSIDTVDTVDTSGARLVLDEAALARLRELDPKGENRLIERVLKAFDSSVSRLLPQLLHARSVDDRAGIRHVAHTLKSSAASIGAIKLSQICAEIESQVRLDKFDRLGPGIDAMCRETEFVLKALHRVLNPAP